MYGPWGLGEGLCSRNIRSYGPYIMDFCRNIEAVRSIYDLLKGEVGPQIWRTTFLAKINSFQMAMSTRSYTFHVSKIQEFCKHTKNATTKTKNRKSRGGHKQNDTLHVSFNLVKPVAGQWPVSALARTAWWYCWVSPPQYRSSRAIHGGINSLSSMFPTAALHAPVVSSVIADWQTILACRSDLSWVGVLYSRFRFVINLITAPAKLF